MPRVYVGVGSNYRRAYHIQAAVNELGTCFGLLTLSSVYESQAVGSAQGNFYNLVVGLDTCQSITSLRQRFRQIEKSYGRERGRGLRVRFPLDIDLLLYGDYVGPVADRFIPRPDIEQYAFVLCPLAEIAGEVLHPQRGECYLALWQRFDKAKQPLWQVPLALHGAFLSRGGSQCGLTPPPPAARLLG